MLELQEIPIECKGLEYFAYDKETTDVVFCVEDKRLYLSRGVLMQASQVFKTGKKTRVKLLFLAKLTRRLFFSFDVSVLWNMLNWMVRKDINLFLLPLF